MQRAVWWITYSAVAVFMAGSLNAGVLTFDVDDVEIPQSYGDGFEPNVDVSYEVRTDFGDAGDVYAGLHPWGIGYGTLENVAWGGIDEPELVGVVTLTAQTGFVVTLESFDLASYVSDNTIDIRVYDALYNELLVLENQTISSTTFTSFSPMVTSETLRLQWKYPYRVAIDNVAFSQATSAAVPEPSSLALACLGLVGVAARFTRRRRAATEQSEQER